MKNTLKQLHSGSYYYSLVALEKQGVGPISHLPVSIRVVLESLLRNLDNEKVTEEDIHALANWNAKKPQDKDIPFSVARVLLQDFTGVPLLVDLAAMRDAVLKQGLDPRLVEPRVPVDLIVDHSVQVDKSGTEDSFLYNVKLEFERNKERYSVLKWGQQAFHTFKAVPPGVGICHQVNLEHLAQIVLSKEINGKTVLYFDTLVGTDSHTPMVNGIGVVGWGVGGIEAEAAMLGQPVSLQMPEVIGVHMSGKLQEGVTATDLTLRVTEMLREENVVGKFVEYYGEGASSLSVADRATMGNMSPEYGATIGYFPVDEKSIEYMHLTGRDKEHIQTVEEYLRAQNMFGIPKKGEVEYTKSLDLDLGSIRPCVAGPKRPQDRILLSDLKEKFQNLFTAPLKERGYAREEKDFTTSIRIHHEQSPENSEDLISGGTHSKESKEGGWSEDEMLTNRPMTKTDSKDTGYNPHGDLKQGSVVIAAITSCTNTSNPSVMIGAGLLAKKAVEKGLKVSPLVKSSLAPGSRVVTDYLKNTDLQKYLDILGFNLVAYGCTTCIGNSGPLDEKIEKAIKDHNLVTASVLSGNRNFEARIHGSVKANFLMSPPLVVAFAIAGTVDIDLEKEPLGKDDKGNDVFLKEIWPSSQEIESEIQRGLNPEIFKKRYAHVTKDSPVWDEISPIEGSTFPWDSKSTYVQNPPYFEKFEKKLPQQGELKNMRVLAILGDSVTTDHISPAGAFSEESVAGKYLLSKGVEKKDFNSYGSRRGNHEVMVRGTFANVRIHNFLAKDKEGGYTTLMPDGKLMTIYEACEIYRQRKEPLIIFAGKDYGMGSSRDWAAKGTILLGVQAVVAENFERIHRSNLIGMGVMPFRFEEGQNVSALNLTGEEKFSIYGLEKGLKPRQDAVLEIEKNGETRKVALRTCIHTPTEVKYFMNGGIMPYVLRQLIH